MYYTIRPYEEMPEELGWCYAVMAGEVRRIEIDFQLYSFLISNASPEKELLHKAGRDMFGFIALSLKDGIVNRIFKLVDVATNKDGDKNLSLKALISEASKDHKFDQGQWCKKITTLKGDISPIIQDRMKRTSHFSKSYARSAQEGMNEVIRPEHFRVALDGIEEVMDFIRRLYVNSGFDWKPNIMQGERVLLTRLAMAEEYYSMMSRGELERPLWQQHLKQES